MKSTIPPTLLVAAVLLANAAATLLAEEPPASQPRRDTFAESYIDSIDNIVNLTDEQKDRIRKICDDSHKAAVAWMDKNREKSAAADKAVSDAAASGDEQAMARANEVFQAIHAPMINLTGNVQKDLMKVLTREQRMTLLDSQAMQIIKVMTEPAVLKANQLKQIKAAYRDMRENPDPEHPVNFTQVLDDVLLPEQKTIIQRHRSVTYCKQAFAAAKLTEEQLKRIERISDELANDPESAPHLYELLPNRVEEILTKEQRTSMQPQNQPASK